MNAPPTLLSGWTRKRFWCVAGVLFAVQAGLILLFAESGRGVSQAAPAPGHFRLLGAPLNADQLAKTFFAIDPTVFSLPGLHGFSERAWLRMPMQHYEVPAETEAPAWLELNPAPLGTNFPMLNRPVSPLSFSTADQNDAALEPWPLSLTPETPRTQSAFKIQGELAGRPFNAPVELRAWPAAQLLSNSVVQIAVDWAGQVVSSQLLTRSGSMEADTNALDLAARLRFQPAPEPAPVWGKAVFEWQTVEPTNAAPPGLP